MAQEIFDLAAQDAEFQEVLDAGPRGPDLSFDAWLVLLAMITLKDPVSRIVSAEESVILDRTNSILTAIKLRANLN